MVRTIISWVLAILIAVVFIQSLFFKFTGAEDSIYIFSRIDETVSQWIGTQIFEPYMRYGVGAGEALASVLLLLPATRVIGAGLAFILMTGAIFFHLFTALEVAVRLPSGGGEPDPSLFVIACVVWVASLVLMVTHRRT